MAESQSGDADATVERQSDTSPSEATLDQAASEPVAPASQTNEAAPSGLTAPDVNESADEAVGAESNDAEPVASAPDATDIVLLARAISELRASIDDLREQNQKIMAAVGVENIRSELQLADPSQPSSSADSLVDIVMDLRDRVAVLAEENQAVGKLLQEQTTVLKPIPAPPTVGTLVVENNTESDQYVWINGTGRWIWANTTSKVTVPVGQVTTKISGEQQKTWEIKAPAYEERIEFVRPTAE
jgi:hypothetical protein